MAIIREAMSTVYESEEEWSQAAATLAGIDLDSGQRVLEPAYKLQMCIRIAQLYLVRGLLCSFWLLWCLHCL